LRSQLHDATSQGGAVGFLGVAASAGALRLAGGGSGGGGAAGASTDANDELIEILEDEKREMREAFEQKIQDLTLELEQANKRRLKEARK
jgi:molybdenum-dependent DNA-binding transcriptional regulator ModE